jgi:hypothetical protein
MGQAGSQCRVRPGRGRRCQWCQGSSNASAPPGWAGATPACSPRGPCPERCIAYTAHAEMVYWLSYFFLARDAHVLFGQVSGTFQAKTLTKRVKLHNC